MKLPNSLITLNRFTKKVGEDDVPAYSGQSALFIIISFFPFAMFLLTLIQFLPITEEYLLSLIDSAFPDFVDTLIRTSVSELYHNSTGSVISLSVITALWSASRGILAVVRGLNSVYHIHETRHYLKLRIIAVFYTLIFAAILILTLGLLVFGNTLYAWSAKRFPFMMEFLFMVINWRTLFSLVMLILFFWALFSLVPNRKTRFFAELPGAVVSACGWMAFSFAYSFYIENMSNFSYMYGSLAAIVLLMLWLYFCMYIMFLGAEINTVLQQFFPNFFHRRKKRPERSRLRRKEGQKPLPGDVGISGEDKAE